MTNPQSKAPQLAKLKWRCRRGTKELDSLLEGYLDRQYLLADGKEQLAFEELLHNQDAHLIGWLLGEQLPETEGLVSLVKKIRSNANF